MFALPVRSPASAPRSLDSFGPVAPTDRGDVGSPTAPGETLPVASVPFLATTLLAAQSFIESHGLQLVHDPGAHLHHAVPVPQQLPHIAIVPAWHPDPRKTIFE